MALFDNYLNQIKTYLSEKSRRPDVSIFSARPDIGWPSGGRNNLVLSSDTAVELGSPKTAATSFLLWTESPGAIRDKTITLIGPDIPREKRPLSPFGKAVLLEVSGFDENNSYDRYREMELAKYDVSLAGYMMRAVSQYRREWSRISKSAVSGGFSLSHLGSALINELTKKPYVHAAEIVFVTSSIEDVLTLKTIGDGVGDIIGAMNKMVEEMNFDCSTCEYRSVCDTVSELRKIRNVIKKQATPQ